MGWGQSIDDVCIEGYVSSVPVRTGLAVLFLFQLLALWGNKNWPSSMKVKKLKIFQNKMALKKCKWSSLNAPGTENRPSHSFLGLEEFLSPIIGTLGYNKIGLPSQIPAEGSTYSLDSHSSYAIKLV